MFFSLFSSKSQKLVKKWKKEHEQIVALAHKVIAEYQKNNLDGTKKYLKELNELAVDHIMNEDIEFYRLQKDHKNLHDDTGQLIEEFVVTFKSTKVALMKFLTKYTRDDAVLDDQFFKSFNDIVGVLAKRIEFEENNLYTDLGSK